MINFIKKSTLTAALFFCAITMFAQKDPFSGSKEFKKLSIGINGGTLLPSNLLGGYNDFTKSKYSLGYGANVKYQMNHYLALQADFLRGTVKGDNSNPFGDGESAEYRPNYAFETDLNYAVSLSTVFTFGNVNWLKRQTVILPYFSIGGGLAGYRPNIQKGKEGTMERYDVTTDKNIKELIVPVGVGLKFLLSNSINLDLGYKQHIVDWDNFDGTVRQHGKAHRDKFSYAYLGLEFALGKKGNKQLMFDNPVARNNDLLQTQITNINNRVDSLAAQLSLTDSDGDGVPDQFDKEPNTPAGCPVDFRGVSLDTDGDGVPDCRDKELITPTSCQPVDADGVGKCPDPACCSNIKTAACDLGNMPVISFSGNSSNLSNDAKAMLATVASKLKASAACTITVTGYPAATKRSQAMSNSRTAAIKAYLTDTEGISADRIITNSEVAGGDANVVDIRTN